MSTVFVNVRDIKAGKFIMIDGFPSKVVDVSSSKPGKHGSAKVQITGIGIFDGQKRMLFSHSGEDVEAPLLERKRGQVISVNGDSMVVMDLVSFENFDIAIPPDMEGTAEAGKEIDYIETMGRRLVMRIGKD